MLFERKRVVQVMSRQGRSKRRMPRFPRCGGRSALVVALHARARLLGRRRRRGRVRYSRERSSNPRCLRECLRRSRWPRRRRGGGCLLGGRRAAAKHGWGSWGLGQRRRCCPQRWVQARGVVRGEKLFMYVRSLEGQWCGQTGRKSRGDFEVLVCYMTLAGAAAPHRVFALERSARHQPALPYTLCDTLKTSYRRAGLGGSRKPCQSLRRAF